MNSGTTEIQMESLTIKVEGQAAPQERSKVCIRQGGRYESRVIGLLQATTVELHRRNFAGFGSWWAQA